MKHSMAKSRSYWPAASHIIALNYISLTFSPGGPLGPGKPCYKKETPFCETPNADDATSMKRKGTQMPLANIT